MMGQPKFLLFLRLLYIFLFFFQFKEHILLYIDRIDTILFNVVALHRCHFLPLISPLDLSTSRPDLTLFWILSSRLVLDKCLACTARWKIWKIITSKSRINLFNHILRKILIFLTFNYIFIYTNAERFWLLYVILVLLLSTLKLQT